MKMESDINAVKLKFVSNSTPFVVVGVFLVFLMSQAYLFGGLVHDWQTYQPFSHGFLIPLISLYFIWSRRGELAVLPIRPSLWGAPVLLIALLMGLLGQAIDEPLISRVSMIIALA